MAELADFCRREHPLLVGALGFYVGSRDVAEDLAQETLLRACLEWETVRYHPSPHGWVMRVGFNLARSRFRRLGAARRATVRLEAAQDSVHEPEAADVLSVRRAVLALPERQRRALVLRFYAGLSVRETAEHLGCPEGTVKTLTYRAIGALRRVGLEVEADG